MIDILNFLITNNVIYVAQLYKFICSMSNNCLYKPEFIKHVEGYLDEEMVTFVKEICL